MTGYFPAARPTLEAALRDVHADGAGARAAAAERLADAPDDDATLRELAVDGLVALARDPAPAVRRAAVAALGHVPDPRTLEAAAAATRDADPAVAERGVASWARLVAELPAEDARGRLGAWLDDPRPAVRFQAVQAVAALGAPAAAAALAGRLDDPAPEVRAAAAAALGELGDAEARGPLGARLDREGDPAARLAVAVALADLGDGAGGHVLVEALGSPEAADAIAAAEALGALRLEAAREPLARRAGRRLGPLLVRAACAAALAGLGDPRGVEGLRAVLRAWRGDGRTYAARAAGRLRLTGLRGELADLAEHPRGADPEVVAEALRRLDGG